MATERALVANHVGLRLAARGRHDELRNSGNLRPHGAEAEDGTAADRMPVAKPVPVIVAIPSHRSVMRMRCQSGGVIVLVNVSGLIALMVAMHRNAEGDRDRERR